jgi:hypothetical protein
VVVLTEEVKEVIEVARAALEVLEATGEVIEVHSVVLKSKLLIKMVTQRARTLQPLLNESCTNNLSCFYLLL